ncbi:mitochondrial import inner membrane translocase subunit Tim21 isoform X2 [Malaclemys terrapin pileata]|uniref:mitochondrial import inner membrane translocase subunit Tim21 isoform X2 n=1 Tax=Malaclemys terrapin pileata TaxID=2991368 RepID=UPI0023A8B9A6|nr:mitochondrial import inner membrane translocase subunit Tim21 isoform X2 [Malaclemys terrapin pileata]
MFSASFMRVIQCSEKLQGSPGKWLLAPHGKMFLRTWRCFRWGQEFAHRESVLSPRMIFQVAKQNIWTQEGSLRAGNKSKQVSVQRSQKGGAPVSAAQKGGLFYVIFTELFSSSSPSKIYGDALEKCRSHPEVIGVFGEPIKGYGEPTRRGRRQLVSHFEYVKNGLKYMRLKFYIEGSERGKQGTVHVEVKENPESRRYEYRYIFVDVEAYPRRTIVIEDNR